MGSGRQSKHTGQHLVDDRDIADDNSNGCIPTVISDRHMAARDTKNQPTIAFQDWLQRAIRVFPQAVHDAIPHLDKYPQVFFQRNFHVLMDKLSGFPFGPSKPFGQ